MMLEWSGPSIPYDCCPYKIDTGGAGEHHVKTAVEFGRMHAETERCWQEPEAGREAWRLPGASPASCCMACAPSPLPRPGILQHYREMLILLLFGPLLPTPLP